MSEKPPYRYSKEGFSHAELEIADSPPPGVVEAERQRTTGDLEIIKNMTDEERQFGAQQAKRILEEKFGVRPDKT